MTLPAGSRLPSSLMSARSGLRPAAWSILRRRPAAERHKQKNRENAERPDIRLNSSSRPVDITIRYWCVLREPVNRVHLNRSGETNGAGRVADLPDSLWAGRAVFLLVSHAAIRVIAFRVEAARNAPRNSPAAVLPSTSDACTRRAIWRAAPGRITMSVPVSCRDCRIAVISHSASSGSCWQGSQPPVKCSVPSVVEHRLAQREPRFDRQG